VPAQDSPRTPSPRSSRSARRPDGAPIYVVLDDLSAFRRPAIPASAHRGRDGDGCEREGGRVAGVAGEQAEPGRAEAEPAVVGDAPQCVTAPKAPTFTALYMAAAT
jgi:hypothetical protein